MKSVTFLFSFSNFKKLITFTILVLCIGSQAQTPQYYNLNNGTSVNSFPFNQNAGKGVYSLFLSGEINQPEPIPSGKQITKVYFRMGNDGTRSYTNLHICLAQDTITSFTQGVFYSGTLDTVFKGDTSLTSSTGNWMGVTLKKPFPFNPAKSLILFVGQCGTTGSGVSVYNTSGLSNYRRVWSVGGCPFVPYTGGDGSMINFGVDCSIVPVELTSFTSLVVDNSVVLQWATSTEKNNYGFDIERSNDNKNWKNIGFVNGNGTTTLVNKYSFTDKELSPNKYYYRIKQIDFDGSYQYFTLNEGAEVKAPLTFNLGQNYPNPFNPVTKINFQIANKSFVTLKIFDLLGNEISSLVNEEKESGYYEVQFESSKLNGGFASGVYIYELKARELSSSTGLLFRSVKKMTFLK